jgi:hypothetical protein
LRQDACKLRVTGADLRVPTYALALAKVAHADQFLHPEQDPVPSERLTKKEKTYFDVDTAVRYARALEDSGRGVKRTLGLHELGVREVMNNSATIRYPGLVLLPLAIYK